MHRQGLMHKNIFTKSRIKRRAQEFIILKKTMKSCQDLQERMDIGKQRTRAVHLMSKMIKEAQWIAHKRRVAE